MNRCGAVIVFKEGTTREQAEQMLDRIRDSLDEDYFVANRTPVHEYDDLEGNCRPVWYIP